HDPGLFNSVMITPPISLQGVAANTAFLKFVSSWRPEGRDDGAPNWPVDANGVPLNNQTAVVTASFDGAPPVQLMKWDSIEGSPTFHTDMPNEAILLPLNNPAGAQNVVLRFALLDGANDWWWAVDNIAVTAGASLPTITAHPIGGHYSVGGTASMSVTATGSEPFTYQWKRNGQNIAGATGATLNIDYLEENAGGAYTVVVGNAAGTVESNPANVVLRSSAITADLVAHLKFDQNLEDSAKNNDGTAVGSPAFIAGKIGQALHITTGTDYVSLGRPTDLNFGTSTDFSISFWAQVNGLNGDPSIIGNKDWDSGSNPGYVLFSAGNRRIAWNLAGAPGGRKDSDAVPNTLTNGTWKHVVATFDRDGNAVIFVDGVAVRTVSLAGSQNNLDTPEGFNTNIGQDGAGDYGSVFTDLRLDDLGIWRRVLTVQEVQSIFAAGTASKDLTQGTFTAPVTKVTGQWDFNSGNLSATVGQPLAFRGDTQTGTTFSTMTIGGQPAQVMGFPAATAEQGYVMPHGAAANGGGAFVNVYTLIMDVMFPADSTGKWRGLFQTSESNANDGDLFVNTGNGIGISGNYPGQVRADTWHRIAFVIDLPKGTLAKYIDGAHVGTQAISGVDGRFSLGTTALLFTDEDGETAAGFVNSIQFREGAMRASEIAALGAPTAAGIPASATPPAQVRAGVQLSGANVVITASTPGTYQLQRRASLNSGSWENVGAPSNAGTFTVATDGRMAFFRLVQTAQ
ncbi:MAG TPA: LamG-like jellyroll fold domain-containing protein, partial [Methylomirabilota bacterium]|nr:LamG-like jellyroll fold domain-containing protein [Methylomirabilota bacterium]